MTAVPITENSNFVDSIVREVRKPELTLFEGRPVALVPDSYALQVMEDLLVDPPRKRGTQELTETDSFIEFVVREGSPNARIYVSVDFPRGYVKFTAVLNEHEPHLAHWRDYRATYEPKKSVEWHKWLDNNGSGKSMTQAVFATFLEDNIKDIAPVDGMPGGNDILAMALNFESKQEVIVKSSVRLQSNTGAFTYIDSEDDATVKRMEFFQRFTIGIAPFFNGQAYPITVRLKYKHTNSKLAFWYELIRPDLILQDATLGLIKTIKEVTNLPLLFGNP